MTAPVLLEREKRPFGIGWVQAEAPENLIRESIAISAWSNGRFFAISTLVTAKHHSGNVGPEWLISISRRGPRCANSREVRRLLRDFGMWPAEEDNHERGRARKFWLPVDPAERGVCECKTNEEQVVESDGYTWSRLKPNASSSPTSETQSEPSSERLASAHRSASA